MRISIYLSNACVSGGCMLYFWDWSIYRKFCKNWRISFLDDCRSIAAWVMVRENAERENMRGKLWSGGIQHIYFYPAWWEWLLWHCRWAPLSCWRLSACRAAPKIHAGVTHILRALLTYIWENTHTHRACRDSIWGSEGEKREWECVGTLHEFIKNGKQTLRWIFFF